MEQRENKVMNVQEIEQIQSSNEEQRFHYFMKEVVEHRKIWILIDEHGSVMLNTEEEDCVPVWPHKEFAESWATGEWEQCQAEAISLNKWHSRWTVGLEEDDLSVVVFPNQQEKGEVLSPEMFDFELTKQERKG